ncbi:MAG: ASKHA domain-containing protein [Acutalibacteraceae bacterium]
MPSFDFNPIGKNFGFAVDIGTTTVAVYGYDLKNGKLKAYDAFLNPQCSYGGDVISRIEAALRGNGKELSLVLLHELEKSFKKICRNNNIDCGLVDAIVITGNTTMMYLLLKEDVTPISKAPFEIDEYLGKYYSASECGIDGFDNATIFIPRTMSAFVGSDITCSVLSAYDLINQNNATLIIDIGTNGEMALFKGEKLVCCSTAAGPAFEGAGITMGSVASDGAINKVYIENGKINYTTINNQKPIGICGSGLIDAVSVFLQLGIVDEMGCIDEFNEDYSEYITEYEDNPAVKIGDSGILITQKDIRTVQLAKAAICAGIYSLINELNIEIGDIDKLLLAGGFGSFIDVNNAGEIGLIPKELAPKTVAIGNAAGMGAITVLLSKEQQKKSFLLAEKSDTVDLSSSAYFMDKYVECMMY